MLWNSLRWNLGNTSAIAAFCLLPIVTFAIAGSSGGQPADVATFAKLQNGGAELGSALPVLSEPSIMRPAASGALGMNDRACDAESRFKRLVATS